MGRSTATAFDLLHHLPDSLVLQEIIPRLDPRSRVRAAAVSSLWRDLSRRAPPPADDGIPWMMLSDQDLAHCLLQPPPPSSLTAPHRRPSSPTVRILGEPLGSHGQYSLVGDPPLPRPSTNESPPELYMFIHNPFQPADESFRIPLSPKLHPSRITQISCFPHSSNSNSNKGAFPPNFVAAGADAYSVFFYRPGMHDWDIAPSTKGTVHDLIFYKGDLYCICRKREIKALDFSNNSINAAMSSRIVVPAKEDDVHPVYGRGMPEPVIFHYLVESCTGELLVVTRSDHAYSIVTCTVHRVEEGKLVEVDDLGDTMLFVREGCSRSSRSWPRHSRQSSEFFTNNSIYFFRMDKNYRFSLGKFSLGNGSPDNNIATFHPVPIPSAVRPCWITPIIPKY